MKLRPLHLAMTLGLTFSSQTTLANDTKQTSIEVFTVKAPKSIHSETALAEGNLVMPDVADWLKTVPGANINKNGPITGIAPVNSGIDTLGGSVEVNLKRAAASEGTIISGDMATSYNDINNASTLAANVNISEINNEKETAGYAVVD